MVFDTERVSCQGVRGLPENIALPGSLRRKDAAATCRSLQRAGALQHLYCGVPYNKTFFEEGPLC